MTTKHGFPWEGDDLPSGEWTLELPVDLPAGVGLAPLTHALRAPYWAVFFWDGTEARVLSVFKDRDRAWPAIAVAVIVQGFMDQVSEADLRSLHEHVAGADSQESATSRTREWLARHYDTDDPLAAMALASMPTPKVFH